MQITLSIWLQEERAWKGSNDRYIYITIIPGPYDCGKPGEEKDPAASVNSPPQARVQFNLINVYLD